MSGNLFELAQRFVRLSSELDATRDGDAAILFAGLSGPRSPGNRPGDLLAWLMTPEVHTGSSVHRTSV